MNTTANAQAQDTSRADANRYWVYVAVLLVAALGAFGLKLRTDGIFACPADAYGGERYLGYCNATGYGDYDHGAIWFGLEPQATANAERADVVFLGNSRLQFGFSSAATADWFRGRGLTHYLFGFSHTENVRFVAPLLKKRPLRARAYVINVDRFFEDRETAPLQTIRTDPEAPAHYLERRRWQGPHRVLCGAWAALCGGGIAYYRDRADGSWAWTGGGALEATGTADGPASAEQRWPEFHALARAFIADLPVDRRCVVLTIVPSNATRRAEAQSIADALGMPLVTPPVEGLRTFDTSHLDRPSAERWSKAFMAEAGERLAACVASSR